MASWSLASPPAAIASQSSLAPYTRSMLRFARVELASLVFCDRIVRTSASSTEGESPHPARSADATTADGRVRGPCSAARIRCARRHSSAVGWANSGKGDWLANCAYDLSFFAWSVEAEEAFAVDVDFWAPPSLVVRGDSDSDEGLTSPVFPFTSFSSSSGPSFLTLFRPVVRLSRSWSGAFEDEEDRLRDVFFFFFRTLEGDSCSCSFLMRGGGSCCSCFSGGGAPAVEPLLRVTLLATEDAVRVDLDMSRFGQKHSSFPGSSQEDNKNSAL